MDTSIVLPPPRRDLSFPLMGALEARRSRRKWGSGDIGLQVLSDLLWAACGISKAAAGRAKRKRTAPSATNAQEIGVYLLMEGGAYRYDEEGHELMLQAEGDYRGLIGTQRMMRSAPMGLVYVSDYSKLKLYLAKDGETKWFVSGTDAAFIAQNVYLYCAAAGLHTTIIGLVDRQRLHGALGLRPHEQVVYTQAVGPGCP